MECLNPCSEGERRALPGEAFRDTAQGLNPCSKGERRANTTKLSEFYLVSVLILVLKEKGGPW